MAVIVILSAMHLRATALQLRLKKSQTKCQLNELIQLYDSGLTTDQIAERVGFSNTTVKRYLRNNGVKMRGRWGYKNNKTPVSFMHEQILKTNLRNLL